MATKPTSEACKPSWSTTFDEACAHPEAELFVHHGQAGPVRMVTVGGIAYFPPVNDAAVLKPKVALSNAREPSAAPETASTAEAPPREPPCAALCAGGEATAEPRLSQCTAGTGVDALVAIEGREQRAAREGHVGRSATRWR